MQTRERSPLTLLTPRELDCLRLVALHLTSKAIAKQLGISPYTVDKHLREALQKLGVSTRREAAIVLGRFETPPNFEGAEFAAIATPGPDASAASTEVADEFSPWPGDSQSPNPEARSRELRGAVSALERERRSVSDLHVAAAGTSADRLGVGTAPGELRPDSGEAAVFEPVGFATGTASAGNPGARRHRAGGAAADLDGDLEHGGGFLHALAPAQTLALVAGVGLGAALLITGALFAARMTLEAIARLMS
ncbi:MAG: helix-turn-helix transcriptional regulator [Caulobacterales bacterium]|nr:helix-turn-helix transcriptional regulator [Caulobacterales bacterium]